MCVLVTISASWISNTNRPTDPGGGNSIASNKASKSAWALSPGNSRNHSWTLDEQSYPQLRRQLIDQSTRLPSEHCRDNQSDPVTLEPVKTVREKAETGVGTHRGYRRSGGNGNKSECANVSGNDLAGRMDVDATLPAVLAGDVAVGGVGFAGSVSLEGAPLADCVGVASPTGRAEAFPLAVAEVASSADIPGRLRPLLGWRPRPLLLS